MELFSPAIAFGVAPLKVSSVPVALVGVQSVDQVALSRRVAKLSLPNACCVQALRVIDLGPSVKE